MLDRSLGAHSPDRSGRESDRERLKLPARGGPAERDGGRPLPVRGGPAELRVEEPVRRASGPAVLPLGAHSPERSDRESDRERLKLAARGGPAERAGGRPLPARGGALDLLLADHSPDRSRESDRERLKLPPPAAPALRAPKVPLLGLPRKEDEPADADEPLPPRGTAEDRAPGRPDAPPVPRDALPVPVRGAPGRPGRPVAALGARPTGREGFGSTCRVYGPRQFAPDATKAPANAGAFVKEIPAASYSPRGPPPKYHRRWRA